MGRNVPEGFPMWLWHVLVCQVTVLWISAQAQNVCDGITGGVPHGSFCYVFSNVTTNWTVAEENCVSEGGHLATVPNATTQSFLNTQLSARSWNSSWIGGQEVHGPWRWVTDGEVISSQGCFTDKSFDRDLPTEITPAISDLTPQKCIAACKNLFRQYAGVQNQLSCFCGNSFGKYGATEGCTVKCEITKTEYCGGFGRNFVYQIGASYAVWATGQPNDKNGYQTCAAIDYQVADGDYSDELCSKPYRFICTVGDTVCNATNYVERNGICYFISTATKSWFEARAHCVSISGDLLKVSNASVHDDIKTILLSQNVFDKFWISLVSGVWKWSSDGQISSLVYSKWQGSSPSRRSATCLKLQSTGSDFSWVDASCSDELNYVCQLDPLPTTTSTTTTTTPTTTTTTATTTTTTSPTTVTPTTTLNTTTHTPSKASTLTSVVSTGGTNPSGANSTTPHSGASTDTATPPTGAGSTNSASSNNSSVSSTTLSTSSASSNATHTNNSTVTTSTVNPNSLSSSTGSDHQSSRTDTVVTSPGSGTGPTVSSTTSGGIDVTVEGPNTGGSTEGGGLSVIHIVLIVCFAILAVAIITGVIMFVYYKKKNSKSSISPYNVPGEAPTYNGHVTVNVEETGNAAGLAAPNATYFDRDGTNRVANGTANGTVHNGTANGNVGSLRLGRGNWHGDKIFIEE